MHALTERGGRIEFESVDLGAHLLYCPTPGNQLATLTGRQARTT